MKSYTLGRLTTVVFGLAMVFGMIGIMDTVSPVPVAQAQCDTTPDFDNPWSAEFYNNQTFSGTPVIALYDTNEFSQTWSGSPVAGINADGWSARIIRYVDFKPGGNLRITMQVDDVGSLYIDDQEVGTTDSYKNPDVLFYYSDLNLTPGEHKVIINVVDFVAEAYLHVDWDGSETGGGGTCATAAGETFTPDYILGPSKMTITGNVRARVGLNLRSCPSFDCNKLSNMSQGTTIMVVGRTVDNVWANVVVNGQTGWTLTEWVNWNGDLIHVPVTWVGPTNQASPQVSNSAPPETQPSENAVTVQGVPVRAIGNVRLRECPSSRCARLGYIAWGKQVMAYGKSADGLWLKVGYMDPQLGLVVGWSSARWYFNDQFQPTLPELPIITQ